MLVPGGREERAEEGNCPVWEQNREAQSWGRSAAFSGRANAVAAEMLLRQGFPRVQHSGDAEPFPPQVQTAHVPPPAPPELFSIELRTTRWRELVEWYRSVLELRVLIRAVDDGYALLQAGTARLAILDRPETPPASNRWSLSFEVADLALCRNRLRAAGAVVHDLPPGQEGFLEIVTHDPDGNRLRLFAWGA